MNYDTSKEKKSLLERYDIPLNHLDFDYIKKVHNVKELEQIYHILKSNDVGYFPELTKTAEDKLKHLNPNSRFLRNYSPALTRKYLNESERNSMLKEIEDWKDDMESKESILYRKSNSGRILPPVRKSINKIKDQKNNEEKKEERIKSDDYDSWNHFDADKECLRLDLEDERRTEERLRQEKEKEKVEKQIEQMSPEDRCVDEIKELVSTMSNEEREIMALKEKDIGNEYYKTHHLDDALKHYTRSIYMSPNVTNLNNRAMTYLKQCKFSKALIDLNEVLKMDPDNVKARYRRATAFQHKCEFLKALDDIRVVLKKEPNNIMARYFADRLREDCSTLPRKHRLRLREETGETRIVEVTEEEMLTKYKDKDFVEINDFGLPKIMCNCNGKYVDDPGIRHEDNVRFQHLRQRKHYEDMGEQLPAYHHATNQPIIQALNGPDVKPTLPGGGRRLEIVELDSINEENEDSSQLPSCTIRDMRSNAKDKKTTVNLSISQQSADIPTTNGTTTDLNNQEITASVADSVEAAKMAWVKSVNEIERENTEEDNLLHQSGKIQEAEIEDSENITPLLADDELPPKRAEIVEMMDDDDDDNYYARQEPDLVGSVDEKPQSWREQWLQRSVTSVNSDFGKCIDLNGPQNLNFAGGDLSFNKSSLSEDCQCSINLQTMKPQNFIEKWNQVQPDHLLSNDEIRSKAALLKCICPSHIPEVFSLNVNETILTDIINCLCYFFDENYNNEVILDYVRAVTKLQRFNIIIFFVAADVKEKVQKMLLKMGSKAEDIRKAFR